MEIFMHNVALSITPLQIAVEVARVLHSADYVHLSTTTSPMNFDVRIHPRKRSLGSLTLPTKEVGERFLEDFSGPTPKKTIFRIKFELSRNPPRKETLQSIRRIPYVDPRILQDEKDTLTARARMSQRRVPFVRAIQFGRECRDNVFSVEWEEHMSDGRLWFNPERSDFRIESRGLAGTRMVAIRAPQIYWTSAGMDRDGNSIIFLSLNHAPSYETDSALSDLFTSLDLNRRRPQGPTRLRLIAFHHDHVAIAPFTSMSIRLICSSSTDLDSYRSLCDEAKVFVHEFLCPVEYRGLFSSTWRDRFLAWVSSIPWTIAFQVEALSRNHTMDLIELMSLRELINRCTTAQGVDETATFLRYFNAQMKAIFWNTDGSTVPNLSVQNIFTGLERDFFSRRQTPIEDTSQDNFQCLHAIVTPTTIYFEGPFPERSNRVMRSYPQNQDSFLRVSFVEENRLSYRFDREIDGRDFINKRVLKMLIEGLWVGGRHFRFLAYSQSALKEHAVWFVKEFTDSYGNRVNAPVIIASLGSFRDLIFDQNLIRCPARYGARISQAFTATDSSLTVEAEEVFAIGDIERENSCFTDGVGTISTELARAIWAELCFKKGRLGRTRGYPRAFQIRFQGSKGMLSVDYRLKGRSVCTRPSMIKFEAPQSLNIEIARAFDKPGRYFLNRPLIMLLEGLGIPYTVFETLQDAAVHEAQDSVHSLDRAARLLESYGLGTSFRLTSVMLGLHRLGLGPLEDVFWQQMMDFAVNHVLRELKHHARIPVPNAWTLVGVADVHGYLKEGEIFACIDSPNTPGLIYLEGPTTISRSPTIHPGDVQKVRAIGRPPAGSPFEKESLRNCVVFSIQGSRSLPSCLGGGDLDGDVYNVSTRPDLLPPRTYQAAAYAPAEKHILDRESTMDDVAEFVAEYINSDTLGIIAINWLIIADQSDEGILDRDCLQLAALHSNAVDYPKSGKPVPLESIPKLKFKKKPDWNAPETATDSTKFYQSQRAIGRLAREIDLPALRTIASASRNQRQHLENGQMSFDDVLDEFYSDEVRYNDVVQEAMQEHVMHYINLQDQAEEVIHSIWELYGHYVSQMRSICTDHTLSYTRSAMLTEEEAVVGTIVAKCSQPRKRKDTMSHLREQTAALVNGVRGDLTGDEDMTLEQALERAWIAYRLAIIEDTNFGARSFAWVALGAIFDVTREIDQLERRSVK